MSSILDKLFAAVPYEQLWQWGLTFCKNLVVAAIVYFIGRYLIKLIIKLFTKMLEKSKVDTTLYTFLNSIINVVCWFVLAIVIVGILGIETSSFIALFASAGVAIGMALSGTLQNFAGGVMILLFRPFKVGDFIEAQGYAGIVKEIQIFNTIIRTGDAQIILIPNGTLSSGTMKNSSKELYRRVDLEFQFEYGADYNEVKAAIMDILKSHPQVIQGPVEDSPIVAEPWIGLLNLGESGVTVVTRSWCKGADYWAVYFNLNETVYQMLKERGFMFPFNRVDVNILNNK
ncbi:mechanosensitive ion channel domain-containing protein [uncultured Prevotella sp.]|jgi:small conductance mechanosensitive channel|uniref:mechanosensitive ion channel family protein n=1 Tax=uncultured Prevotella sp. TaxID=159272 RepID=UPI002588B87A|nr:mechanosensitive ion channel domain-containing protein [uncultured Prevotella sp.]